MCILMGFLFFPFLICRNALAPNECLLKFYVSDLFKVFECIN